ncbi:GAF domain-containing protein [Frondihabitans sp. PhB188]|uniref:GAF domain-containing protein n=1 Tax=Frondihabitans sp. PhB188 TaxID=2485200 RepID=UPI000FB969AB|nr:GAF domain-containing protein [Frondihabitans sp. PhB188]ROQ37261.1 GAF domain-containing protein [Frondihabitans sp. PhB188]
MLSLLHSLALPFFRGRFAGVGGRLTLPRPDDPPWAHAPGVDPDRILIFGNGAAVGWGVRSHDLALPGQLARQVSNLTGRGSDVDLVADPTMITATATRAVPVARLVSYDAMVVALGLSDALRMTSPARYERDIRGLLSLLIAHRHEGAEIALVAIHRPSSLGLFSLKKGSALDRHADRLNAIGASVCESLPGVRFVTMSDHAGDATGDALRSTSATDLFRGMASTLAAHLVEPLDAQFQTGREACPLRTSPQSDEDRLRAIHRLGILDSPAEKRFDDIVERARILLAASGAAFSVVDDDRVWNKSISGDGVVEFPLRGAMCAETIRGTGPFIVPDVWSDDRFVTHPSVRFYAGYPIEGPGGLRIGALCVTDPQPRLADSVDLVLLRELALAVQRELAQSMVPLHA